MRMSQPTIHTPESSFPADMLPLDGALRAIAARVVEGELGVFDAADLAVEELRKYREVPVLDAYECGRLGRDRSEIDKPEILVMEPSVRNLFQVDTWVDPEEEQTDGQGVLHLEFFGHEVQVIYRLKERKALAA